jgi:hypothetical protein
MTYMCSGEMISAVLACATLWILAAPCTLSAAEFPQAEISNGQLKVQVYLPDAKNGFYRSTRFDWSGMIGSLEYQGHNYYGPWFSKVDPKIYDFGYEGIEVVAAPLTAATGPAEEFQTSRSALGWDEAKPGGTFVKIGVGVLRRKDDSRYDPFNFYEIVDTGKWTVKKHKDSIEFIHELGDPASGYAYVYRKAVRLIKGKPEMVLEHSLKNTGKKTIESTVYNHNFLALDHQPPGPDFTITVPFKIQARRAPNKSLAEIRGNQIVYLKTLENQDCVETSLRGFSDSPKDNEIRIENKKVGAGVKCTGDKPLEFLNYWSIRTVLAAEPFIAMKIEPGGEFTWKVMYEYYTLPANPK